MTVYPPQGPALPPPGPFPAPPDRGRALWRPVVAGAASLGAPVGIGALHPVLGEVIAIVELAVGLTVIAAALFGSQALSERAFRLLRWFANRPEPPAPTAL
jgi:hypothetical protein